MKNLNLKNCLLLTILIAILISCEKDFASLDSAIINPDNAINFTTPVQNYPVITYNKKIGPVQTNGLASNLLGYYNNAVFGTSNANFVSQMSPADFNPTFGNDVVLDSVVLTIPYFSSTIETDEAGDPIYTLDSIFGDTPIKLSVFKNNFFLRDFNPDSEFNKSQKYYSNGSTSQNDFISPSELEGELLYEDFNFLPSSELIRLTTLDETTGEMVKSVNLTPGIRVLLENPNGTFWQDLIFSKEGEPELSNQNNFLNYFRGLYIKSEAIDVNGTMMMLDFTAADANIILYYTSITDDGDDSTTDERKADTFTLNFMGNRVNIFDNNFLPILVGDQVNGDERLYLNGGEGSMAVVNLFNGDEEGNSAEFEQFKFDFIVGGVSKRLINEAYLEFFVDQNIVQGQEPDRVYLYDLNNKIQLVDYVLDQSVSATTTKLVHLEPLSRVDDEVDGQGIKYKIRITEHINNIILKDSTNVKLGLVVTSNVSSINNFELQTEDDPVSVIPSGTILSPKGTVLYGNNASDENKKVTLKIYYTEPKN